jgi:hypothetical protein
VSGVLTDALAVIDSLIWRLPFWLRFSVFFLLLTAWAVTWNASISLGPEPIYSTDFVRSLGFGVLPARTWGLIALVLLPTFLFASAYADPEPPESE